MASAAKIAEHDKSFGMEFNLDKLSLYEALSVEMWEFIFLRLKYEKICELRLVCKTFNQIGKQILEKDKIKVENKLVQHLELKKTELLKSGNSLNNNATKYLFLYFLNKSRDNLCNLFRKFIGGNVECFTLGKMMDFLLSSLKILEDDELWNEYLTFSSNMYSYWRKTYDKHQMKFMGEFDYCLWMWLRFGENSVLYCHPVEQLLHPENCTNWEEMADYLDKDSGEDLVSFNIEYNYDLNPVQKEEPPHYDYDEQDDSFDDDEEEDYGSKNLLINEHWIPYVPPPMDEECILLFKNYLL